MIDSKSLCAIEDVIRNKNSYPYMEQLKRYDQNTYQHSVDVCYLAFQTGRALSYDEDAMHLLALCGLMHDIGKVYMPRITLFKKGSLTEKEYDFVKKHTLSGYEMVKNRADIPDLVKHTILCHHENEDGSGYPNGRTCDQIHEYAKIVHVCDVYDAMISTRSYKDHMAPATVVGYMKEQSGTMFNEDLLNVFISNVVPKLKESQ